MPNSAVVSNATDPAVQTDPKWVEAFAKGMQQIASAVSSNAQVKQHEFGTDRENWTSEADADRYNDMIEKNYIRIDVKGKRIPGIFYRVIHCFPQYQTANPNEYKAVIVVEQWKWEKGPDKVKRRKVINSFNVMAKEFDEQYKQDYAEDAETDKKE